MKMTVLAMTLLTAILVTQNGSADTSDIEYLVIAADLSGSASLIANDNFARAAINRITQKIRTLKKGAYVEIKTFGDGSLDHMEPRVIRISSRGASPDYVANLVASTLNEIRTEVGGGQSSTNLLGFLEVENLHCDTGSTEVLIVSDAIESSEDVSATELLNGSVFLPEPDAALLSGCRVEIIGLGNVSSGLLPRDQRKNLETAWNTWFDAAGADEFVITYRP